MIDRREILDIAAQTSLTPHVVEKDYVLGWMLAGIYAHEELAESWIFKGGTCLKKCFFETYRFSEDLDFTLRDEAQIDETFLKRVFAEVGAWIYETTGIEIPVDQQEFDIYQNPRGKLSCQGKISYRGPVSPTRPLPRIKLDLTADERVVLPPVTAEIFHPYSDMPEEGIEVLAYDYVEAFAEKFRALAERTRPRDLYDVVNLYRNTDARPEQQQFVQVLREKCTFKGIELPRLADIQPHRAEVEAGWVHMLNHQLPALLPVNSFWDALAEIFDWLHGQVLAPVLAPMPLGANDALIRDRIVGLPAGSGGQSFIEMIRFAAANRLLVEIDYRDKKGVRSTRAIEAYSLRRSHAGDVLLMAVRADRRPSSQLSRKQHSGGVAYANKLHAALSHRTDAIWPAVYSGYFAISGNNNVTSSARDTPPRGEQRPDLRLPMHRLPQTVRTKDAGYYPSTAQESGRLAMLWDLRNVRPNQILTSFGLLARAA